MDPCQRREITGYSDHCRERMAQRNVSDDDIRYIVSRGVMEHRTGVQCFTLPRRSIPTDERSERASLESLVVMVHEGCVITVYRNRHPLRHVRRKAKYHDPNLRRRRSAPHGFAFQS
jgi:hypothetical protein